MIRSILGAGAASCIALMGSQAQAAPAGADMILYNGKILTVDRAFSTGSVVVIADGKIVSVGGPELLKRYRAGHMIDLHGRTALPGFNDTHFHPRAVSRRTVNIAGAKSIAEIQDRVRAKARELGPGEWIVGYGWAEDQLAEHRNVVRADLDAAAPDNPVALSRAGGHSIVGNSAALKLAGIDRDTPQPDRGVIEHDAEGNPNGIIRERMNILASLVPQDAPEDLVSSYVDTLHNLTALGITSVNIAAASLRDEITEVLRPEMPNAELTYKQLRHIYALHGTDLPRATVEISYPGAAALKAYPHKTGYGDTRIRLGAIGEMPAVDGGFTGPTAWTTEPYKGQPDFHGQPFFKDDEDLATLASDVADNGWQLGLHAIGDASINMAARVYARVIAAKGLRNHRWYLAHFTMLPTSETMATMARSGIWAEAQPNFLYNLEVRYLQTLTGKPLQHNNPVASPMKAGVNMAFGSDNLPVDPRVGLYVAVTRKGTSGAVYGAEEAIPIREAIRAYTQNGAYLSFEENLKGSIEPGKLADIVVLDADPTTITPERLLTMKVEMTIIGGKVVYASQ